ncbi:unnamed protein product [Rhizophagus irregularis]|uniref:Zinc finger mym-type protein 2-like: PROVISIONAL n=1 Tax=Rhizophagus irregularis TaxID=588596 RepID=A0A916A0C9_9GLOM|nr:unnamed protein product [Rhizophagus irregularis]
MPRLGSKNKEKLEETTTPKVDFYREFSKVTNTVKATDIWIGLLEKFRDEQLYIGKIQEVESEQDLIEQLCSFFANMKKKDGADYSVNSIRASLAAVNRFLQEKSRIKNIDLYNDSRFKAIKEVVDGKIRFLSKNGKGETKGADSLKANEITQILNHRLLDGTTPERLLRRVFFINAIYLELRGGEHALLNGTDFVKCDDGEYNVFIYCSKNNQRGLTENRGKADKLVLANHPEVTPFLDTMVQIPISTFRKLKKNLVIYFNTLKTGIWYKPKHVGFRRLNSFLNEICKITGINFSGRKITNHSGRRALIQNCEKMGVPKEEIKLLSRHRSDAGLLSYTLPPDFIFVRR